MLFNKYLPVIFIAGGAVSQTNDGMEPEFFQRHGTIRQGGIVGATGGNLPESQQIFAGQSIMKFKRGCHNSQIQPAVLQRFQNLRSGIVLDTYFDLRIASLEIMEIL